MVSAQKLSKVRFVTIYHLVLESTLGLTTFAAQRGHDLVERDGPLRLGSDPLEERRIDVHALQAQLDCPVGPLLPIPAGQADRADLVLECIRNVRRLGQQPRRLFEPLSRLLEFHPGVDVERVKCRAGYA